MTDKESEDDFKRRCDLLVQRGFAGAYVYDDTKRTARFAWHPAGHELRRHLRQLFDIPNVKPIDLTPEDIASTIMVLLITPAPPPPNEVT